MFNISIASGKGGTGKTFVATNLFETFLNLGIKTTLADCDVEEPNAAQFFKYRETERESVYQKVPVIDSSKCNYCGKCQNWCVYNSIIILKEKKIARVLEDMCHGCGACSIACDYGAIYEKEYSLGEIVKFSDDHFGQIIEGRLKVGIYTPVPVLKKTIKSAISGLIILDSPPGTSCPFIHTVNSSDYVLLVTEPTPFGLNDLKISVDILRKMDKPFSVIINKSGLGNTCVSEYLKRENIEIIMEIPFDKEIAAVYSRGDLTAQSKPIIAAMFSSLARMLINKIGGITQ